MDDILRNIVLNYILVFVNFYEEWVIIFVFIDFSKDYFRVIWELLSLFFNFYIVLGMRV